MSTQSEIRAAAEAVDTSGVRRRGLGSPKEFRCPGCASQIVKVTGKTRPYSPRAALGTRGNLIAAEYVCECGHNGWTNHNDIVKESSKMNGARAYFFDSARPQGAKEIKESDRNATRVIGLVGRDDNSVGGVKVEGPQGPVVVTIADFPMAEGTVRVKLWMPGKEPEWLTLKTEGLVNVEVDSPNVQKFAPVPDEAVLRVKRIETIVAELRELGVPDAALQPILDEVMPF